jgi:hypothetical protein
MTDILTSSIMLTNLPLQPATQSTTLCPELPHWLSESEDDQPVFAAPSTKQVQPIRLKVPKKRNVTPQKRVLPGEKPKRVKSAKSCRTTATVKNQVSLTTPPPAASSTMTAHEIGFDQATTRRLKLENALELAGKLYDCMNERKKKCVDVSCDFSVFSMLCTRNLLLESLASELCTRNVLPVTINTLSKLYAQTYAQIVCPQ